MKKKTIAIAFILLIAGNGLFLMSLKSKATQATRDYQIEVKNDSIYIYNGSGFVKNIQLTDDSEIGNVILDDNL